MSQIVSNCEDLWSGTVHHSARFCSPPRDWNPCGAPQQWPEWKSLKDIESLPELASQQFSIHQTQIHVNDSVNTSYIWIILHISWTSYILATSGYIWFHAISIDFSCSWLPGYPGYPGPQVEIGIRLGLQKGKHLRNPEESLEESLPVEAAGPVPTEHAELQFQFRNQMTQPMQLESQEQIASNCQNLKITKHNDHNDHNDIVHVAPTFGSENGQPYTVAWPWRTKNAITSSVSSCDNLHPSYQEDQEGKEAALPTQNWSILSWQQSHLQTIEGLIYLVWGGSPSLWVQNVFDV